MYKDVLRSIEGVELYPVISLVFFICFFVFMIIYIFRIDKKFISSMENMPLDEDGDEHTVLPNYNEQKQ